MKEKFIKKIISAAMAVIISSTICLVPAAAVDKNSHGTHSNIIVHTKSARLSSASLYSASSSKSSSVGSSASGSSSSSSSSGGSTYYYNTGAKMPKKAKYGNKKYKLLTTVKKGDILYEARGGGGYTGHSAIVEGIFTDTKTKRKYVRIIEAIDKGVKRGILDDTRMEEKKVTILRVKNATTKQINKAVAFSVSQRDKDYFLDFKKDTKSSEKDWYCSELVWASYKNQGINLETTGWLNEPGITPRDILRSDKVKQILKYK